MTRTERMQNAHFAVASNETNPLNVRWRIHVYCPNCDNRTHWIAGNSSEDEDEWGEDYAITLPKMRGGCILCCCLHERLNAVVHRPEWRVWRRAMCRDRSVAPICADWLDEQGLSEVAAQLRVDWNRKDISEPVSDADALNDLPF